MLAASVRAQFSLHRWYSLYITWYYPGNHDHGGRLDRRQIVHKGFHKIARIAWALFRAIGADPGDRGDYMETGFTCDVPGTKIIPFCQPHAVVVDERRWMKIRSGENVKCFMRSSPSAA